MSTNWCNCDHKQSVAEVDDGPIWILGVWDRLYFNGPTASCGPVQSSWGALMSHPHNNLTPHLPAKRWHMQWSGIGA